MEVVNASYLPGDPRLIDQIVYELKSQGIFDQFRKECIADVDTKPAYQNLRQRVEGSVAGFLRKQTWRPDMNKNHVREMLRKNIYESGFLETGVERIVDQVVNPKINTVFLPQVEDVFYRYLGIERPNRNDTKKEPLKINVDDNSLLPTDLEAVSPESVHSEGPKMEKSEQDVEDFKMEEDESPPFEPLEQKPALPQEESSVDSHLSGFSGLASHDSNNSIEPKTTPMEISNQDSQLSKQSSDDHLSIVTSDENNTKMDICDDSRQSKSSKSYDSNTKFNFSQINTSSENSSEATKKPEQNNKVEEKKISDKDKRSSSKHRSRHDSRDHKDGKEHKENKDNKERKDSKELKDSKDRDKKNSREKHSSSSKDSKDPKDKDKDRSKDSKSKSDKSKDGKDREHKSDKERDRSKSSSRHNSSSRDKSYSKRDSVSSSKDRERDKSKSSSRDHKDSKNKDKSDENKSKNDKDKSDENKSKNDKDRGDSKNKDENKSGSKKNTSKSERDKKEEKRNSHNYDNKHSSSSSKNKDKKDSKKDSKGMKDDHFSSKDKKSDRRSTDRDSNDGHSGNKSASNAFISSSSSNTTNQKDSQESSGSISGGSGDSRTSDSVESEVLKTPVTILTSNLENNEIVIASPKAIINNNNEVQQFKLIKPKFATNIHEARRLMKIRKQLDKLEKQRQNEYDTLLLTTADNCAKEKQNGLIGKCNLNVTSTVTEENVKLDAELKSVSPPLSSSVSKDSWDAVEAQLNKDATVDYSVDVDENEKEIVQPITCATNEKIDDTNECHYLDEKIPKMAEAFLDYASAEMEKLNTLIENFHKKKLDERNNTSNHAVKRKFTEVYSDVTNNNKYNNNVIKGDKKEQKKNNLAKVKKTNNISAQSENFVLPLSVADSEVLNKKSDSDILEKPKRTINRTSIEKSQRYSNDDLYKPRPFIRGSRSRSGKNSVD